MEDFDLYAYGDDVSDLRRQLGEDPLDFDGSHTEGYSEALEQSAFSDNEESDLDNDDDSLSDQSDASFVGASSPPPDSYMKNVLLYDDDPIWTSIDDSDAQAAAAASTRRLLALTSPRGSHRTHEIFTGTPDVEDPISSVERKAMKKARRKSLHSTAQTLSKAVAHLKDLSDSSSSSPQHLHPSSSKDKSKSKERNKRDSPSSAPSAPTLERPPKLKRGRSRSLTKALEKLPSKLASIAAGSQSSDSGGSSGDLLASIPSQQSRSPTESSGSLEIVPSGGSLKHSSASIRPPILSSSPPGAAPTTSNINTGPLSNSLPAKSTSPAPHSKSLEKAQPLSRSPSEPLWSGSQPSPPPLQYEQLGTTARPDQGQAQQQSSFLSILKSINEKPPTKSASSSSESSDLFKSSASTAMFGSTASMRSTADDEEMLLYVTPEKDIASRRPLDIGISSVVHRSAAGNAPSSSAALLKDVLLSHMGSDPRLAKYKEVLDLFNGPQLEALLRMMDDLMKPADAVAPPRPVPLTPPPPPEIDLYVGEETITAAPGTTTHQQPNFQSPQHPTTETNHDTLTLNDETYKGWKNAMSSELKLRRELVSVKNWNEEFQRILRMPQGELNTFSLLRSLGQDFVFTAETYGRIIISEMHLSPAEKTIKPVKIGGVAGGYKYICQGILFKFAVDTIHHGPNGDFWMYGGSAPCTEYAMKAAKHDLRGVISLYNCHIPKLRVALVALIDFRGFRLIAQALLPINKQTLRHGSDDGGLTFKSNPELASMMQEAGRKLNLKEHKFIPHKQQRESDGVTPFKIVGPADIEGHIGDDGEIYIVDVARLFPPEAPSLALHRVPRSEFFYVLRPELVKKFRVALSSDAWTAFGHTVPSNDDAEVAEATLYLQRQVIPDFAEKVNSKVLKITTPNQLVEEAHRSGINLRYLGSVRAHVTEERVRALILLEMVLRVLKGRMRHKLRRQMERTRISTEAPYAAVVLSMLNLILYDRHKKRQKAKTFWTVKIKALLREKFIVGLTAHEMSDSVDLKSLIDMQQFLNRFQVLTGVKLIPSASIYRANKTELIYTDIEEIAAVTHHMNIVNYSEGSLLLLLSRKKKDRPEKLRLLNLAEHKLRLAKASAAGLSTIYQLGNVYYENTKQKPILQYNDVINATKCFGQVIEQSTYAEEVHQSLFKTLKLFYRHVRQAIWLQKKLFRKKASSHTATPSSSLIVENEGADSDDEDHHPKLKNLPFDFNKSFSFLPTILHASVIAEPTCGASVIPADEYFTILCARYLDRLATFSAKEAAKFVRRACIDQGDALKWVLLVAEHSSFVSHEVIRRFSRCESLDFRDQPQLFMMDPNTLFPADTVSLGDSGSTAPSCLPPIFKIFRVLQEEKRTRFQPTLAKSSDQTKVAAAGAANRAAPLSASKDTSISSSQPHLKQRPPLKITEHASSIPRQKTAPVVSSPSVSAPTETFLMPITTSLNLRGCVSLTLSTLSVLLRHSPNLEALCLDYCSHITDDLWQLLKKQRTRPALRLKQLSLAHCVSISDSFFTNMAAQDLLRELQVLNVSHCRYITNVTLRALSQQCTKLQEANFGHCAQIHQIWLFSASPKLQRIDVASTATADADMVRLTSLPFFTECLQDLDISDCKITDDGFTQLSASFRALALRKLRLANTHVTDKTLDLFNRRATSLIDLDLGFQEGISRDAIVRLGDAQTSLQRLKLVSMKHGVNGAMLAFEHLARPPPIEQLELPWCSVRDLMVLGLAKTFKTLRSIDLTGCREVSNHSLSSLSKITTLTYLNLSWCSQIVDSTLNEILKSNKSISHLAVAHCAQLSCESLNEVTRAVIQLDISNCQMFSKLGKVPSRCLSLRQLNMASTQVAPKEIKLLFGFGISLTWLSLKECRQVDNKVILRTAKYCPALSYIDLDTCTEVTDDALIELFSSCKFLQTLLLPGVSRITDAAFTVAAERDGLQFLREVNLSGCRKLSDVSISILTSRCSAHLRSLNLSGLNNVTSKSISMLIQKCRHLVTLNLFGVSASDDIIPSSLTNPSAIKRKSAPRIDERLQLGSATNSPMTGSGSTSPRDSPTFAHVIVSAPNLAQGSSTPKSTGFSSRPAKNSASGV